MLKKKTKTKADESLPPVQPVEKSEKKEKSSEVENLPSVEWGERLASGKAIARGGKEVGHVPGASPAR